MPDLSVILFDAGNTLIHPALPVGEIYAEVAGHYGLKVNPRALQVGFARAWEKFRPRAETLAGGNHYSFLWWKAIVSEAWAEVASPPDFPFDDYFTEVYQSFEHPRLWRVFPDAQLALDKLAAKGVRLGILSNWDVRLRTILKGVELYDYFEHLIISEEVGVCKPHPDIFRLAAEKFGVAPGEITLIGDDPECDGAGATQAGIKSFIIRRPEIDVLVALESAGI